MINIIYSIIGIQIIIVLTVVMLGLTYNSIKQHFKNAIDNKSEIEELENKIEKLEDKIAVLNKEADHYIEE